MELARHRALTHIRKLGFHRLELVEMELARHRALTQETLMLPSQRRRIVEMELARHRALTQGADDDVFSIVVM